ncbi:response regulator [Mucilaginibacter pedocola]|uniref:Response regulatory domain-containing protein n=1 Tax=Mucilaginibacter pedocola TaxID=1792845 RepID=A0A1S9PAL8_9SPHI|nr:response regulator [Mucilaginibacter pedocola]OOQ57867.1 hypothetical protein BC343_13915 [Mucilaginibacter pedocola]
MKVWLADDESDLLNDFKDLFVDDKDLKKAGKIELVTIANLNEFQNMVQKVVNKSEPVPSLIFLDLRFRTIKEGYAALDTIKKHKDSHIKTIPLVMFSSSRQPEEVKTVYEKLANVYVEKGAEKFERFKSVILHWHNEAILPN